MINYGALLLAKEKDNPSSVLRTTYLFSNVGDLVKCYGRIIRFPCDAPLCLTEIKLALGDIMMQCRMMLEENNTNQINITTLAISDVSILEEIQIITKYAAKAFDNESHVLCAMQILISSYVICMIFKWEPKEIEHLGYQHVMERFEQFEREGWQARR